jgi:hypothetical protein
VELGTDQDGEPFGTCIVEPQFDRQPLPTPPPARKARESASLRTFRDAFTEALNAAGKTIRVRSDGPTVRAVDVAVVRAEFDRRYATGEPDPEKRKENQRKAFARAMSKLSPRFPTLVDSRTEWIWSLDADTGH